MKRYWINSRDYILIVLGALIQAVSLRIFFVPADLASGGVSGIAQLINFYTEWPIGLMVLVGNVPLFLLGWRFLGGRRFALRTAVASFALHADVAEFLDEVMHDDDAEHRIQQVRVVERSAFVGRTTGQLDVPGRFGTQLLAVRAPRKGAFIAAPAEDTVIEVGSTLIVFGTPEQVLRLRQEANGQ